MIAVIALSVMLALSYSLGQGSVVTHVKSYDSMADKACLSSDVVFTMEGVSVVRCVALCGQRAPCKSVFYKTDTMGCSGCSAVYPYTMDPVNLPDEAGTQLYSPFALYGQSCSTTEKPCIEDKNVCFPGLETCVCDGAANYNPGNGTCTSGCSRFGNTYQLYPRYALVGYNGGNQPGQSNVSACLEYCHTATLSYTCYVVDYDVVNNICIYNYENARTVPAAWVASTVYDSYVRNCE